MAEKDRGFASMPAHKRQKISSKGGTASHAKGVAHEWTSEEAREGARTVSADSQLTTLRIQTRVLDMGSLRQSIDFREGVLDFRPPALRWLPRAFKNLGRGVF